MALGTPYGLQAMLKEGHKTLSGVDEVVLKNADACKGLAQITRTSLGPNGGWYGGGPAIEAPRDRWRQAQARLRPARHPRHPDLAAQA